MAYQQLLPDDGDSATKEQLLKLKEYKEQIGIPAERKSQELQLIIETNSIETEQLRQELETVKLQLQTYAIEVEKLKSDRNDLEEEVTNLNKLNSSVDPSIAGKAIQEKDDEIEALQNQYEKSQSQLLNEKGRLKELERENKQLLEENQQYEMILEKLQKEETSLKDKINRESQELRKLKHKYEELEVDYHTESAFSKHQSVLAQELQNEVKDLRTQYQRSLQTIDSTDQIDHFTDSTNKNLGGGHAPAKTIRVGPQTLRLANIDSDNYHQAFPSYMSPSNKDKRESDGNFLLQGRLSALYDNDTIKSMKFVEYDQTDRTNPLSDDEHNPMSDGDGEMKVAQDYDLENIQNELREQLLTEFDDRLAKEKGKLIDKHKLEIQDLTHQFTEATDNLKDLKRKLVTKDQEIQKLKRRDGMKNRENSHQTNPNNQQDLSKCKVFGWVAW